MGQAQNEKNRMTLIEHPWKIGATDWDAVKAWLRKDDSMTHWRDPHRHMLADPAPSDVQISNFRVAVLTFALALVLAAVAVVSWGFAAEAQCPPDKPFKRIVEGQITQCTLVMCIGKLICDDKNCWRGPAPDCNTCYRSPDTVICLSQEELDRAK